MSAVAENNISSSAFIIEEFYGRYEPQETLGVGVSSVVRRCVEKGSFKEFAVKIIDKNVEKEQMVRQEIEVLVCLGDHPNLITLVDYYETNTTFFLVLPLAKQGELFDHLTQSVKLSEHEAKDILYQILCGVDYMHSKKIVHRDLKPENILINGKKILISDFGFATKLEDGHLLKELCGTPDYLAPEVLRCSVDDFHLGYDLKVDLWACGVILYIMLAGFSPFWHRRQATMLWNIMDGKYNLSSPEWDTVSENAKNLITKLLNIDPHSRLSSKQTLNHVWLQTRTTKTLPRKANIKILLIAITFVNRFKTREPKNEPVIMDSLKNNPYNNPTLRKIMDSCAFNLYERWIKRSNLQVQNRAALFETNYKNEQCTDHCENQNFQYRLLSRGFF